MQSTKVWVFASFLAVALCATVMLLGTALGALGMARRFLMS